MPECRLCGVRFPYWISIDGRSHNLSNRKYCLTCSPFGQHNTRILEPNDPRPGEPRRLRRLPDAKRCPQCGLTKRIEDFYLQHRESVHGWCKLCNNEHRRARFRQDRLAALAHYSTGDIRCVCCGERNLEFLGLDHINDDGAEHRRQLGHNAHQFYSWLRKTDYTYRDLAVACHNCNMARAMYGECPHRRSAP
jgi:hypothetical protein